MSHREPRFSQNAVDVCGHVAADDCAKIMVQRASWSAPINFVESTPEKDWEVYLVLNITLTFVFTLPSLAPDMSCLFLLLELVLTLLALRNVRLC